MSSSWDIAALSVLSQGRLFPANRVIAQPLGGVLTSADVGKVFYNSGAIAISPFTLPNPAGLASNLGWMFGFLVTDADGIRVTAPGGTVINVGSNESSLGGTISSTTIGSCVVIVLLTTGRWVALMGNNHGAWSVT